MSDASYLDHRGEPRVVITGMGAITPIGNTVDENWESLMLGRSGIRSISRFDAGHLPCQVAGEVRDFKPKKYMSVKEARRYARSAQFAIAAARQALADAGLEDGVPDEERTGVIVGTGMGGFDYALNNWEKYKKKGLSRVSPFSLVSSLPNMPSHHVSVLAQARGPINTVATACATGTQSIGEAVELIRRGKADMMIAGGVESVVHESAIASFSAMRGLSTNFNDEPHRASRPFNKDRDGFVFSEGVGLMVLERLDQAIARGANIRAEVVGYASCSDAFHIVALDPEAAGQVKCMRLAVEDAALDLDQIDYINAHGTSTPTNDVTETTAVKKLFGERAYEIPISSTKALTGHALGGAGAMEAVYITRALQEQTLPPTWNYETPDPECDLDYIPNEPRQTAVRYVLSNSFGLGGQNACLVIGRYDNGQA